MHDALDEIATPAPLGQRVAFAAGTALPNVAAGLACAADYGDGNIGGVAALLWLAAGALVVRAAWRHRIWLHIGAREWMWHTPPGRDDGPLAGAALALVGAGFALVAADSARAAGRWTLVFAMGAVYSCAVPAYLRWRRARVRATKRAIEIDRASQLVQFTVGFSSSGDDSLGDGSMRGWDEAGVRGD